MLSTATDFAELAPSLEGSLESVIILVSIIILASTTIAMAVTGDLARKNKAPTYRKISDTVITSLAALSAITLTAAALSVMLHFPLKQLETEEKIRQQLEETHEDYITSMLDLREVAQDARSGEMKNEYILAEAMYGEEPGLIVLDVDPKSMTGELMFHSSMSTEEVQIKPRNTQ